MKKTTGFTLIEVLVSLVLLSGGLLGLAALQATSLKNNQIASNRNQATQLAYDMTDRMRTNVTVANSYITNPNAQSTLNADCTSSVGCISEDMAQNDLSEWNNAIVTTLPNGAGSITIDAATQAFTITITWTENIDEDNDGTPDSVTFQTNFQL